MQNSIVLHILPYALVSLDTPILNVVIPFLAAWWFLPNNCQAQDSSLLPIITSHVDSIDYL